jgi:His-Xaa-Ser system protein HxsD
MKLDCNAPETLELRFSLKLFDIETIKKAAYRFTDRCGINFTRDSDDVVCTVRPFVQCDSIALNRLASDFRNEVLDQDLRKIVSDETSQVRNAILAYAFSRTGLQQGE